MDGQVGIDRVHYKEAKSGRCRTPLADGSHIKLHTPNTRAGIKVMKSVPKRV